MTTEGHAIVAKLSANLQYSVDIAKDSNIRKEACELLEQLGAECKVRCCIWSVRVRSLYSTVDDSSDELKMGPTRKKN